MSFPEPLACYGADVPAVVVHRCAPPGYLPDDDPPKRRCPRCRLALGRRITVRYREDWRDMRADG